MNEKEKNFVKERLFNKIQMLIPDFNETEEIAEILLGEVIEDIEETADVGEWHSGDVDMALARVIKKKLQ